MPGFTWLSKAGVMEFFSRYFGGVLGDIALSQEERRRLEALDRLAPGDFKAVHDRFCFLPPEKLSINQLLSTLEDEVRYKNDGKTRRIGF